MGNRTIVGMVLLASLPAPVPAAPQAPTPPSVAERPTSLEYCDRDQFALAPGPYLRAVPAAGATPSRIDSGDPCIEGDLARCHRAPLDVSGSWIAGARAGDWICVTNGKDSGWVPLKDVALQPAPAPARADWIGTWERDEGSASLTIRPDTDGTTLLVKGEAEWMAGPDADPHVGEIDGAGAPSGVVLVLGDARCVAPDRADKADAIEACLDCNARLVLVNAALIVTDNHNCGGMNVNFDGVYHRKRR